MIRKKHFEWIAKIWGEAKLNVQRFKQTSGKCGRPHLSILRAAVTMFIFFNKVAGKRRERKDGREDERGGEKNKQ